MKTKSKLFFSILFLLCTYHLHLQTLHSETIPAYITPDGYIFIDAAFNDTVKTRLMFDTGAGLSVVSQKLFNLLKPTVKPAGVFTAFRHDGERLDGELFIIPKLTIAGRTVYNVKAAVYPPLDDYGIEGVVSLKEFENTALTIDFRNKTFIIETAESLPAIENTAVAQIPLKLHRHTETSLDIFVDICLNDSVNIEAEFDTGSGYNALLINPYYMKSLGADSSTTPNRPYVTPTEKKRLVDYISSAGSLRFCGTSFPEVLNAGLIFRQGLIYEGLIGSGMFRDRSLTIDIPNSRMLVR